MNDVHFQSQHWAPPFDKGEVLTSSIDFTEENIRRFASAIGDFNPLHHDNDAAQRSRFGGLIASGGQTTAIMLGALAGHVTDRCASLGLECNFRLRRGVPAGLSATVEWTVMEIAPKPSLNGHFVTLDGVLRHDDTVYLTGRMTILVLEREQLIPETKTA